MLRLVPATAPVAISGGAHATSARGRRQTVVLGVALAPATMLMLPRLGLRCRPRRHPSLSWRVGRDSELSARCTPRRCAAVRDQRRRLAASLCSVPLAETAETRHGDAHFVRTLRVSSGEVVKREGPRLHSETFALGGGWPQGTAPTTVLILPRLGLRLAHSLRHNRRYVHFRPNTGTRCAGPPVLGPRRLPPTHRPIRRPDEVIHNSRLCPRKRRACHGVCFPDLALVGHAKRGRHRASLAGSLEAIRLILRG